MPTTKFTRDEFDQSVVLKAIKDKKFREELVSNPKQVYARELGKYVPDEVEIRVVEESANVFYLVLPHIPSSRTVSDEELRLIARHKLTHREPCWGLGDGLD